MKKKKTIGKYSIEEINTDFYKANPAENSLTGEKRDNTPLHRNAPTTMRHKDVKKVKKQTIDIRDKKALEAILRFSVLALLLLIILVLLMKGIGLYEKQMVLDNEKKIRELEKSSNENIAFSHDFNLSKDIDVKTFIQHVKDREKGEQILLSAKALTRENIFDKAIVQYQAVLKIIPSHMIALEQLGDLYTQQESSDYIKAINIYQHLLDITPKNTKIKEKLIKALSHTDKTAATIFMSKQYLDSHLYNPDIQEILANAYYTDAKYKDAITAYKRILQADPENRSALEFISAAHVQLKEFNHALTYLNKLIKRFSRNETYYLQISLCHAQIKNGKESVQTLSRAAQIFDKTLVLRWIQDPLFDPIRNDRDFTMFVDRIAGIETRKKMETLVGNPNRKSKFSSIFTLTPGKKIDENILKTTH